MSEKRQRFEFLSAWYIAPSPKLASKGPPVTRRTLRSTSVKNIGLKSPLEVLNPGAVGERGQWECYHFYKPYIALLIS